MRVLLEPVTLEEGKNKNRRMASGADVGPFCNVRGKMRRLGRLISSRKKEKEEE